jgi:Ni,Fe-hydrogenase III small subunit/Pyruvate/2-oxoacid:ferredoxin oxidoreductase delta subunit
MLKALKARFQQGYRTVGFPRIEPVLPDRFRGRPVFDFSKCSQNCHACEEACPTGALILNDHRPQIDMGKCLFCTACSDACSQKVITMSKEYRLAGRSRQGLIISDNETKIAAALDKKSKKLFGRSLKLRQVSAGGCNACEADTNVLRTVVFDLGRFGIQFVASPRHADGLLITGPVTKNMLVALKKTYDAAPAPKIVIAVGACAISGGPYISHSQANDGVDGILPVDLYVPGCPPHPMTILAGLVALLGCCVEDKSTDPKY